MRGRPQRCVGAARDREDACVIHMMGRVPARLSSRTAVTRASAAVGHHALGPATSALLPRLDFHTAPYFSRSPACECIQHRLDALDTEAFLDTVGTSRADLDELLAAAPQRRGAMTRRSRRL
ncbi:hypothetical protein Q4I32_000521 [Leishmania shawi]|uniref:Uncharacterized protein n=1 Tax=Leishmania shawi TaxID=5680 RepID=A0AAW3CDS4_9TRYP